MSVEFAMIDVPYPYVCAVYRCRCGGSATQHGDEAGRLPPGWETSEGDRDAMCPGCARRAAGDKLTPLSPPAPS
jgi:hypothetical protein